MTVVRYMDVICEIWCKIFNLLNLFQRFDPFPSLPPLVYPMTTKHHTSNMQKYLRWKYKPVQFAMS